MNDKKKQFFKVPQNIKTMTDEQIDQWAEEILDVFLANDNHAKEK
jgi:hypothetical protein